MQKITPFLWFNDNAEEAMNYYISVFKDGRAGKIMKAPDGKVISVTFQLNGQEFMALNGGPTFKFTEAVSLFVSVDTQEEVDELWNKLTSDGQASQCGWLKDKYGLSWQIIPTILGELLGDTDPEKSKKVMDAMLQMQKIDIQTLKQAHGGSQQIDQFGLSSKVVIVEDNASLAEIYKARLEILGYKCSVAYDGQEALALIEKELPDLVLLDLMVPKIAGDQILSTMRASEWGKNIKVLIISNLNEVDAPAGLRNQGIEGYAVKANLSNDQLDQLVDSILKPADQKEDVSLEVPEP